MNKLFTFYDRKGTITTPTMYRFCSLWAIICFLFWISIILSTLNRGKKDTLCSLQILQFQINKNRTQWSTQRKLWYPKEKITFLTEEWIHSTQLKNLIQLTMIEGTLQTLEETCSSKMIHFLPKRKRPSIKSRISHSGKIQIMRMEKFSNQTS